MRDVAALIPSMNDRKGIATSAATSPWRNQRALAPEGHSSLAVCLLQVLKIQDIKSCRINTYTPPEPSLKNKDFKSCKFRTYKILPLNPFRMNTYLKRVGGRSLEALSLTDLPMKKEVTP
jgi:hypothetical protein